MKIYQKYCPFLLVSCLIILGTFLRLYHLDFNSFWLDEAATHVFTQQSISDYWQLLGSFGEVHPPLFYIVEKIILPFGTNEFLYRLIPAIFGIATIPLFYIIGKKMFGTPVGIIMAAIITFSPYHVQYSQDARMYTMLLFITAISVIFYLEAVKSNNLKYWILFGLVSALAIWTHFMALIVIGALIIYSIFYLIKEKSSPKNFLLSIVVMTVLLSPLILLIKELFMNRIGSAPTYGLTGDRFIVDSLVYIFGYTPLSFCIFGILFCLGAVWLFSEFREKFYFLFFVLSISIVTGYILCDLMPIAPRYFIFLLPFSYAIIASSALPFLQKLSEKSVITIFVVLFICLWSPQLYAYYNTPINEDWRAAAVFVKDTAKANDIVIIMPDYNQIPFNFYYNNSTYGTIQFNTASKDDLEKINSLRCKNNVSAFILVTNDLGVVDLSGEATTWIRNPQIITEMGNFNGVRVRKITANC